MSPVRLTTGSHVGVEHRHAEGGVVDVLLDQAGAFEVGRDAVAGGEGRHLDGLHAFTVDRERNTSMAVALSPYEGLRSGRVLGALP